jgi:hypothetical protein
LVFLAVLDPAEDGGALFWSKGGVEGRGFGAGVIDGDEVFGELSGFGRPAQTLAAHKNRGKQLCID